ncbi:hypothetical protein PVK06_041858 [Gossypium arboreum]|uniref:Disease resistance N-terminal domain-containing protein n=1 Tax=Gossypium arboreum TaxID=29729 RepID=A0ABR0N9C8_GOSAR|nr:hypothetical protein PVK06_041858 [Gossypium arboreum]
MFAIGEAALSAFFELLGGKLLDSALNIVADHKQLHPQLKQWQSILPDIQAVLGDAEEKQIKNDGVKKWLEDLQTSWMSSLMKSYVSSSRNRKLKPALARYGNSFLPALLVLV